MRPRIHARDERSPTLDEREFGIWRRVQAHDDVGTPRLLVLDDSRASLFVCIVEVARLLAGAGLDDDLIAELDELLDAIGRTGHERLFGIWFPGYAYEHFSSPS